MFLQSSKRECVHSKETHHEKRYPRINFWPEISVMRIKGVIKIKDPGIDLLERLMWGDHLVINVPAP
jgi:hypothetical protein